MKKHLVRFSIVVGIIFVLLLLLSQRNNPERIDYGTSFSVYHSEELKLNWKEVYDAALGDLGVKRLRLSAHWPLVEPENDKFNWTELDYQIKQAEIHDAKVILAVGRRLPGWPECHEPSWFGSLDYETKRTELFEYMTAVVERYKDSEAVAYWQVENEPFLTLFAKHICGDFLDKELLKAEVAHVKSLDPSRPVIVTDSGELSLWYQAYNSGDAFGTSVYIYVWNHFVGPIRYPITPAFFKIKRNIVETLFGPKDTKLIELSLEPWLLQPIVDTPIEISLQQMNIDKFNEILLFAKRSGFQEQYLWGVEWWYFMKENGFPEFWERAEEIFAE